VLLGTGVGLVLGFGAGVGSASDVVAPVHIAFLGDSYTYGVGASNRSDGYAYLVARAEGWTARVVGLPGSGYTRIATKDDKDIAAGIPAVIAAQPQVLIVESGHNDALAGISLNETRRNALKDLRELRAGLPNTTIIVLGPIWLNAHPGAKVLAVRRLIHAAQRKIPDSLWVDPIAQKWFTGALADKSGDDATMINYAVGHPNDLGYHHIAGLLEADLRALGVS
jgi:lysophospholipase L1-like esterase